jgi:uncharacterized protein YlzI (FlbEa/FlbD family)
MIPLTRLDKSVVWVNTDQIVWVTKTPDTTITFSNGQNLMVAEEPDVLRERMLAFRRACAAGGGLNPAPPDAIVAPTPERE